MVLELKKFHKEKKMNKLLMLCTFCLFSSCCTLSLTNISTHGTAEDIVDQEQKQDGEASLEGTFPAL